jgi:glycosyltransferase involved in cell wall biosynthesis
MESDRPASPPEVSVIVPARNEEACLADCLNSLVEQAGAAFEIIVVDDYSTDRTRQIATSFPGVRVVTPPPLPMGWTGKNNALWAGVQQARGEWLLFTDADTVHVPGSLARALAEAKEQGADMLSYSPEQIAVTFWEKAVLPVVFAELAHQYPPQQVSNPQSPIAAANGQYILIRRDTYEAVDGHRAIAGDLLEDVALARRLKILGRKIRFRYGGDAVCTRMYRNFQQLREGWTKNLALLFPSLVLRAALLVCWWALAWVTIPIPIAALMLYRHIRRANFGVGPSLMAAAFGVPMFIYLLLRSKRMRSRGGVAWKGRIYSCKDRSGAAEHRVMAGGVS